MPQRLLLICFGVMNKPDFAIDQLSAIWTSLIKKITNNKSLKFVPQRKLSSGNFPRWLSSEVKTLVFLKKNKHRAWKVCPKIMLNLLNQEPHVRWSLMIVMCTMFRSQRCHCWMVVMSFFWNFIDSKRKGNNYPT